MLKPYYFIDATIVIALLVLAFMALSNQGYKQLKNRIFAFFTLLVAVWMPTNHIGNDISLPDDVAKMANYLVFACSFGAMALLMFFIAYLINNKKILRIIKFSIPILLIIGLLSATPLLGADVEKQGRVYAVIFGPLLPVYGAALLAMIFATLTFLIIGIRNTHGTVNRQLRIIGVSLAVSLPLVVTLLFIIPSTTGLFIFTELGASPIIILVAGLYYSVIKHHLFDIKLAAVRSLAYVLALIVLAAIYYFMAYIVSVTLFKSETSTSVSISPANIFLALILAFMFQPIKQFFDRLTDSIFYRDMYKTDEFFAKISELLGSTTDLRGLLERTATEIASTLKSDQAYFFLYYNNAVQHHMSAGTHHHTRMPVQDAHMLDGYVQENKKDIIITDMLDGDAAVRRMLVSHRIALVMPLWYGNTLTGYLLLGDQQRSGGYNKRDLKVLSTIADELVIGIQNALSIHAVKEINAHLQQRIDVATKELRSSNAQLRHLDEVKDEFMSMASHQLRTPLTSIKGYLSMVIEGDVGKVSPQQKLLLEEAFNSSERMVRLIADFLNVSRLQTGKFVIEKNPVNIVSVIKGEVESLKLIAATHQLKLHFATKEKELILPLDEAKIRQVVMNFVDNAIYYSRQSSTIQINLEKTDDKAVFTVIDTGIGVPAEEQAMLFNKFFRAKNARQQRPDGTGVGLYLAKKVITAHGGKMIFSSVEGEGSTFGFSLPTVDLDARRQADDLKK